MHDGMSGVQRGRSSPPQYEAGESEEHVRELMAAMDCVPGPEFLSVRPGPRNKQIWYISGDKATELANEVFKHGNWSSEVRAYTVDDVEEPAGVQRNYKVIATAVVRVTCQCQKCELKRYPAFHEGIGVGSSEVPQKDVAIANAKKSAETDGLKRALRKFGRIFGSFLADQEALRTISQQKKTQSQYQVYRASGSAGIGSKTQVVRSNLRGDGGGLELRQHAKKEMSEEVIAAMEEAWSDTEGYC